MTCDVLLVGLGRQGREHLAAARSLISAGIMRVVAVADVDRSAQSVAVELGVPYYAEYERALAREQAHAAIICVPNHLHLPITHACLERGLHVLKEKPLALNLADAKAVLATARANRRVLQVAQQRFFSPFYLKAREWLNRVGEVLFVNYEFTLNDRRPSWYWSQECGGGSWFGLGWHACSVITWFLGLPRTVSMRRINSMRRPWEYSTDDLTILSFEFENGCIGRIMTSVVYPVKGEQFMVHGKLGSIEVTRQSAVLYDLEGAVVERCTDSTDAPSPYELQLRDFVRNAMDGGVVQDTRATDTMHLLHAGFASSERLGQPISFFANDKSSPEAGSTGMLI